MKQYHHEAFICNQCRQNSNTTIDWDKSLNYTKLIKWKQTIPDKIQTISNQAPSPFPTRPHKRGKRVVFCCCSSPAHHNTQQSTKHSSAKIAAITKFETTHPQWFLLVQQHVKRWNVSSDATFTQTPSPSSQFSPRWKTNLHSINLILSKATPAEPCAIGSKQTQPDRENCFSNGTITSKRRNFETKKKLSSATFVPPNNGRLPFHLFSYFEKQNTQKKREKTLVTVFSHIREGWKIEFGWGKKKSSPKLAPCLFN